MAIVTPRFTHGVTNYDLPQANEYTYRIGYTSVGLKMANGSVRWQSFAIEGDEDPAAVQYFTLTWPKLTLSELGTLQTVWQLMRQGTYLVFRSPDNQSWLTVVDPDSSDIEITTFVVAGTMYYRASIHLVDDTA